MIKKIIGSALVVSSLMIGSVVLAQTTATTNKGANQATVIACVAPAVATRETAISLHSVRFQLLCLLLLLKEHLI